MDYPQYYSSRMAPAYPPYPAASSYNQYDNSRDPRYVDTYGRSIGNPLPAIFRTAAMTSAASRGQQQQQQQQPFNYRPPPPPMNMYDIPRSYGGAMSSGYISDTNDMQRSSISVRPMDGSNSNSRRAGGAQPQQSYYKPAPPTTYRTKIIPSNDQSYYSDSEYVGAGPRYTKISRQAVPNRRPSNVVLPIRSMTSKAYDEYVPPEPPKPVQTPFDLYRYQQEQQERLERERQEQWQRQLYEQQQQAARFKQPPPQDQRRKSDTSVDHEIGAELLKSPIANKKRYADSSFFKTPFNTYPTIEEQKQMARKIASILQGGDPTQKGASKFEKQRQRAEKYTLEAEPTTPTLSTSSLRPLNPIQTNYPSFTNPPPPPPFSTANVPECIKNSLDQAQHMNPLRYVGAPEEFKQIHMQEHVTHTNVSPQAAMSLVADLNQNRGKGAALFQKRKARSEKWVVDENNVKKSGFQPAPTYISENTTPWGQHAPASWSGDEGSYSGPSFTPVRPKFNPPPPSQTPSVSEPLLSPPPTQNVPRFGDFNAKPKGFGSWNAENIAPQTPRGSIDARKALNLGFEPGIREGIAESHMRTPSQSVFSPAQPQSTDVFTYPSSNTLSKWKNQEYSPWNQSMSQDQAKSQMPMTREGVDQLRQRLAQQTSTADNQPYKAYPSYKQRNDSGTSYNPQTATQGSIQQYHFTDL